MKSGGDKKKTKIKVRLPTAPPTRVIPNPKKEEQKKAGRKKVEIDRDELDSAG